jgi:hypothetical protein
MRGKFVEPVPWQYQLRATGRKSRSINPAAQDSVSLRQAAMRASRNLCHFAQAMPPNVSFAVLRSRHGARAGGKSIAAIDAATRPVGHEILQLQERPAGVAWESHESPEITTRNQGPAMVILMTEPPAFAVLHM